MKTGKLFFRYPILNEGGFYGNELLPLSEATAKSTFILFELPLKSLLVPHYVSDHLPDGNVRINMGLWFIDNSILERFSTREYLTWFDDTNLPVDYQKMMRLVSKELSPIVKVFERFATNAELRNQLIRVYLEIPSIFYTCIARRKSPGLSYRQNMIIVLRWSGWKKSRLSMQERLDELTEKGLGEGLNKKSLSKRAEYLGLH